MPCMLLKTPAAIAYTKPPWHNGLQTRSPPWSSARHGAQARPWRLFRQCIKTANFSEIAYRIGIHNKTAEEHTLAKPNYSFEKRQRELAKKQKKEEKLKRKSDTDAPADDSDIDAAQPPEGEQAPS